MATLVVKIDAATANRDIAALKKQLAGIEKSAGKASKTASGGFNSIGKSASNLIPKLAALTGGLTLVGST